MARGRGTKRGRGGGGGRGRGQVRSGGGADRTELRTAPNWQSVKPENSRFEAYYIEQGIVPPEEWTDFMDAFRRPLPTTFRFTAGKATTRQLIEHMRDRLVPDLSDKTFESELIPAPAALSWYPESLAWQIDVKKTVLRKQPNFKDFQRFLVNETAVGSISRQEAVSMIPPLFLDVRPEHIVLDMCAAPGSKTAQLIEALHSPTTSSPDHYDPCPPGMIIANDSDQKRAYMLVHQASRLPSPNLCVINLDASALPKVLVPYKSAEPGSSVVAKDLRYDRILGDVPCSGDGTLRKNVNIWKDWNINNGIGLHALQLRILLKGLARLRPGGRFVYSTCSLNPIENEAVIAAALRECGADPATGKKGSVRVVNVDDQITDLKRAKGLTTWKVCPGKGRHLFDGSAGNIRPKQEPRSDGPPSDVAQDDVKLEEVDETAEAGQSEDVKVEESAEDAVKMEEPTENAIKTEEPAEDAIKTEDDDSKMEDDAAPAVQPGTKEYRAVLPAIPFVDSWNRLHELDPSLASRTAKTLWPAGDEQELGIENCMRVYPHYQNTGGFFITVLEKQGEVEAESQSAGIVRAIEAMDKGEEGPVYPGNKDLSSSAEGSSLKRAASADSEVEDGDDVKRIKTESEVAAASIEDEEDAAANGDAIPDAPDTHVKPDNHAADRKAAKSKQRDPTSGHGLPGGTPFKEDPYSFIPTDHDQSVSIRNFFQLSPDFPAGNLLVRNPDGNPLRTISLVSTAVRGLISGGGPGAGLHRTLNPIKLRLLNAGVKTFARQEANKTGALECKWRVIADGLAPIRAFIKEENVVPAEIKNLTHLLSEYYPTLDTIPEGIFRDAILAKKPGSHIVSIQPSKGQEEGVELHEKLEIPIWRAGASVNLMLDKAERSALSLRIYNRDLTVDAKAKLMEKKPKAFGGEERGRKSEVAVEEEAGEGDEIMAEASETALKEEQGEEAVKSEGSA